MMFFFPLENPLFYALFNTFERKNGTLIITWPIMIIISIINQKLLSVVKSYIGLIIKTALMMVVISSPAPLFYTHSVSSSVVNNEGIHYLYRCGDQHQLQNE